MLLKNKTAVVTGGSRGIGYAIVEGFLAEGASVVLCASRQETADKAVAKLKEAYPDAAVEGIWPDLSDYAAVKEAFAVIAEKYGTIDILVNNAGVSESTPFSKYTEELMDKVLDLNIKGVYSCSRAAAEYMEAQGSGVIINTSSMVSIYGRNCLSDIQICRKRIYAFPCKGAWPEGHPRQRGSAGHYKYRYDAGSSKGSH